MTYVDYKDEQKRYPKASAKFIKNWFDEHISKDRVTNGIATAKGHAMEDIVVKMDEVEDTNSVSTEGQSPAMNADTPSTSEGAVSSDEKEDHVRRGFENGIVKKVVGELRVKVRDAG